MHYLKKFTAILTVLALLLPVSFERALAAPDVVREPQVQLADEDISAQTEMKSPEPTEDINPTEDLEPMAADSGEQALESANSTAESANLLPDSQNSNTDAFTNLGSATAAPNTEVSANAQSTEAESLKTGEAEPKPSAPVANTDGTAQVTENNQPNAQSDNLEQAVIIAQTDGSNAADMLNAHENDAAYTDALNDILTLYYGEEGLSAQFSEFKANIGAAAGALLQKYEKAAEQRKKTPEELGFVPGRIIVMLKSAASSPQAIAEKYGCTDYRSLLGADLTGEGDMGLYELPLGETVESVIQLFSKDSEVKFAEPDRTQANEEPIISDEPVPMSEEDPWYMETVKAREAWKVLAANLKRDVGVAVIDSGIDVNHEDLNDGQIAASKKIIGGIVTDTTETGTGHGTHVSGIVAATANNDKGMAGVAYGSGDASAVRVYSLRASDEVSGNHDWFMYSDVMDAIKWAIKRRDIKVINMSLGGFSLWSESDAFNIIINAAIDKGVTVVASAGNDNSAASVTPSDYPNCISVIALDSENKRAEFSNYGDAKFISAPGRSIYSTLPGNRYEYWSGTSMAAPIVSAVAAMMYAVDMDMTPAKVKEILSNTATDLEEPGKDPETGWGLINAYEAVYSAAAVTSEHPSDPAPAAPTAPTNVTVAQQPNIAADIKWDIANDATGYEIVRSVNGEFDFANPIIINDKNTLYYKDTNIGTTGLYRYKIRSFKGVGNKVYSKYSETTFPFFAGAVDASKIRKSINDDGTVTFSWTSVNGADGYCIQEEVDGDVSALPKYVTTYKPAKKASGIGCYTIWPYGVYNNTKILGQSVNFTFNWSTVPVPKPQKPGTPSYMSAYRNNNKSVQLRWGYVTNISGYEIVKSVNGAPYDFNNPIVIIGDKYKLHYIDEDIFASNVYRYKIRSFKNTPDKLYSDYIEMGAPIFMGAIDESAFKISSGGSGKATFSWPNVAGASGYEIVEYNNGYSDQLPDVSEPTCTLTKKSNEMSYQITPYAMSGEIKALGAGYSFNLNWDDIPEPSQAPTPSSGPSATPAPNPSVKATPSPSAKPNPSSITTPNPKPTTVHNPQPSAAPVSTAPSTAHITKTPSSPTPLSAPTQEAPQLPPGSPNAPQNLYTSKVTEKSATLKWLKLKGAKKYEIQQSTDGMNYTTIKKQSGTSLTVTKLDMNKTYYFRVSAILKNGTTGYSAPIPVKTLLKAPKTPTSFRAKAVGSNAINISWKPVAGASGYVVYRDGVQIAVTNQTLLADAGLSPNTKYKYTVQAYVTADDGAKVASKQAKASTKTKKA